MKITPRSYVLSAYHFLESFPVLVHSFLRLTKVKVYRSRKRVRLFNKKKTQSFIMGITGAVRDIIAKY